MGLSVPNGGKGAAAYGCTCSAVHTTPGPPGEPTAHHRHPWGACRSCGPVDIEEMLTRASGARDCDRLQYPAIRLSPKPHSTHFWSSPGCRVVTWVLWSVWSSLLADTRLWQCVQPRSASSRLRGLNSLSSRQPRLGKSSSFNSASAVTCKSKEAVISSYGDLLLIRVRSFLVYQGDFW